MTKEALKLALEALEKLTNAAEGFSVSGVYFNEELWARKCLDDAYDAMGFAQEALAQPEQEPEDLTIAYMAGLSRGKDLALQRTWVGLTDDEIAELWYDFRDRDMGYAVRFAHVLEAKLKEKNV